MLPRAISIHPNVVRGEADQCTFAQVAIDDTVSGAVELSSATEETDNVQDSEAYETVLKEAVKRFETFFGEEQS